MTVEEGSRSIKWNLTLSTNEQSILLLLGIMHRKDRDFEKILKIPTEIFL